MQIEVKGIKQRHGFQKDRRKMKLTKPNDLRSGVVRLAVAARDWDNKA